MSKKFLIIVPSMITRPEMWTEKLPRIRLANLPTPLEEMRRFSEAMGGPRVFIKRDDETGLAFGGSKARVLEFCMADARAKGVDVVIATGGRAGVQSNWVRMVASAARLVGMRAVLVLRGEEPDEYDGNLLLDGLLGAEVRFMMIKPEETHLAMEEVRRELWAKGEHPQIVSDESLPGIVGYPLIIAELLNQANEMGVRIDYTVNASGSGGTQAGLLFGAQALNTGIKVLGISVQESKEILAENSAKMANEISSLLGLNLTFKKSDVIVFDRFVKEGYGVLNREVLEALRLVAQTEGIILDPVYTGKAMAGLISLIREGYFSKNDTVVFIHTGGTPALFPYRKEISYQAK